MKEEARVIGLQLLEQSDLEIKFKGMDKEKVAAWEKEEILA